MILFWFSFSNSSTCLKNDDVRFNVLAFDVEHRGRTTRRRSGAAPFLPFRGSL